MIHFLQIPFTGLGKNNGFRGNAWLKARIELFKRFTLAALLNQTKKEFVLWLCFRPEEEKNPLVIDLKKTLNRIRGLTTLFTFHGILLSDDKYPEAIARQRLLTSLRYTLPELVGWVGDEEWVAVTCQPSDDLFASWAVEEIQRQKPEKHCAVGWMGGFLLNMATKEVAEYNPSTLPPFTTIFYPRETFLNAEKHMAYIGPFKSHEHVSDHLRFKELKGRGFMVGTHGANISTSWQIPYKGREILGNEREKILLDFGIWLSDAMPMHKSFRLWGRICYNYLPRPLKSIVYKLYHLVRAYYVSE